MDVDECEHELRDMTLEIVTKRVFESEFQQPWATATSATHALVLYYGRLRHFVFLGRQQLTWLRSAFGTYQKNDAWKTTISS